MGKNNVERITWCFRVRHGNAGKTLLLGGSSNYQGQNSPIGAADESWLSWENKQKNSETLVKLVLLHSGQVEDTSFRGVKGLSKLPLSTSHLRVSINNPHFLKPGGFTTEGSLTGLWELCLPFLIKNLWLHKILESYPHLHQFQVNRYWFHLLNLLGEVRGVAWMSLLGWAAVTFLQVAAEDAAHHQVSRVESWLVRLSSPTQEWLCALKQNYGWADPCSLSCLGCPAPHSSPGCCCSSDKSLLGDSFCLPCRGTGIICFLFKFRGIALINRWMQFWMWGMSYCPARTLQPWNLLFCVRNPHF